MTEPDSLQFIGMNEVSLRQRTLVYFSGCDYFRLARHPEMAQAAISVIKEHGLNVAASRRTTGNHKIYSTLEHQLARFFGAEAALVLPDGYFAPIAAAQALSGGYTHVFLDELAHGALRDAARMFNCPVKEFKHRDAVDLKRQISKCGRNSRPIVLTDGLFGHDGSVASLREYLAILPRNGLLLVDDAHGVGVLGAHGRGALEHEAVGRSRIIQCGTLSKAFGAYGGVVLTSKALREKMVQHSQSFAGTTALPPPLAGAALKAVEILRREPRRRTQLIHNLSYLRTRLRSAGWNVPETPGPIIRLPALAETKSRQLKSRLLAAGIYPPYLKYGKASRHGFFRFVISSEHTRAQLDAVADVLTTFKP